MANIVGPNGQGMMSQAQAAEIYAVQQYQATYLGLVQVCTADALRRLNVDEDWKTHEEDRKLDTDWICDTAKQIATDAMKRLGINIV